MNDLTQKPCPCGGVATEVIRVNHRVTDNKLVPYRYGWECPSCKASEKAIGRETWIEAASSYDIADLIQKASAWSHDRGIIKNGKIETQALKLVSEMGELADNVAKGRDVKDDIGDCLVVLNNIAIMSGTSLGECLAVAYDDIKDRKGYLNEAGVFIKDGDKQ